MYFNGGGGCSSTGPLLRVWYISYDAAILSAIAIIRKLYIRSAVVDLHRYTCALSLPSLLFLETNSHEVSHHIITHDVELIA